MADILIAEAEARTAELRARLADMRTGTKLCEIAEDLDNRTGLPRVWLAADV